MATIKKPASKMQDGGNLKIKVKIKPDRKLARQARKDEKLNKPIMSMSDGVMKNPGFEADKASKDAGFNKAKGMKKGGTIKKYKAGGSVDTYTNYSGKTSKPDSYTQYKKGGVVKAKNGKSFPDLNKDGKITKADILKGRGVIAKSGAKLKKQAAVAIAMKKAGKAPKKMQYGGAAASMVPPMMKKGGATKKCKYGCK
jgi:hypothetical protein